MMQTPPGPKVYGAIEAGGTKFVCAVGEHGRRILAREVLPTTTPAQTLAQVAAFFQAQMKIHGSLAGIGLGCFGPIHIHRHSLHYGHIGATPKSAWQNFDIVGELARLTGVAVSVDTDVNCSLRGEVIAGAGVGLTDAIYLTVGTGIGGGVLVNGKLVYGFAHPEIGHMLMPRLDNDRDFAGVCPFHGAACIEGLASGPALRVRWGASADELPIDHEAWDMEACYLAMLCANLLLTMAPQRIIFGGGVMQQAHLIVKVREELSRHLNGYIDFAASGINLNTLIVPAQLGGDSGIAGCLELARSAA
jgi:fructokinase